MDNSSVADYGSIYLNELNTKAEENERADMEETDSEIERNLEGKSLQKEGMKRKLLRTTLIDAAYLGVVSFPLLLWASFVSGSKDSSSLKNE